MIALLAAFAFLLPWALAFPYLRSQWRRRALHPKPARPLSDLSDLSDADWEWLEQMGWSEALRRRDRLNHPEVAAINDYYGLMRTRCVALSEPIPHTPITAGRKELS